ncbi:hypothetical protein [Glycomyces salinus]|uniref:hypothetical protein n=1 Tax=Glycomyces salinus TaxID=980294 RepID=UPI0018EC540C|nr:hypothetical protein [Glycomyces salinus]
MAATGVNPSSASAGASRTISESDSFASLEGDMRAIVEGCVAAAGESEVVSGYDEFGATWATELALVAEHGESVGSTSQISVSDHVDTDTVNAEGHTVYVPHPS